jgi:hypothetical protein
MSYRQSKRLAKRYREGGTQGLKHSSAGRESNRRKAKKFRERVLRLVGKKYSGEEGERFGSTLAAEHLASDDDVEVNAQTLRRWMLAEGLWSRARKRRLHRKRRERKEPVGELVQMDGSHLETGRILGNDWVVRHDNRYFQVKAQARNYAPAKSKITVCEWEDGRLQIRYRGRAVSWEEIPGPAQAAALEATAQKQKPPTPKADHPWRQGFIARCAPGASPEHRPCR